LLRYMAPTYLTPDTMEQVKDRFVEESSVTLDTILSKKFSEKVREHIEKQERTTLPSSSDEIEQGPWKVARPPHKQRYLYRQASSISKVSKKGKSKPSQTENDPIQEIIEVFLPSPQFRKWLGIATDCDIESHDILARRFRRGMDYSLATGHEGESRLELTLGLTPTTGWGGDSIAEDEEEEPESEPSKPDKSKKPSKSDLKQAAQLQDEQSKEEEEVDVGGHEVYMAADDDTSGADAAIYKAASNPDEEEDDNILFTTIATWNKMSIVLRDSGVLKFVKYVSKQANGDRWDVSASFEVKDDEDDDEEEGEDNVGLDSSGEEEVFKGFPESEDSDSD